MTAVLKHELRLYFHSLTAYVFGAFLLAVVGIGAMLYNIQAAVSNFEFVMKVVYCSTDKSRLLWIRVRKLTETEGGFKILTKSKIFGIK